MKGLYIHVPFCKCRCVYCDFYSTTGGAEMRRRYVDALCAELRERRLYAGEAVLSSVYLGGGTPSQLGGDELFDIFSAIDQYYTLLPDAEITLEANPDDVTDDFIAALQRTPVNRISLGVQSLSDERLVFLRRRHSAAQARDAVERLRKAGYDNISIDLIYGLPNQDVKDWESDLRAALALPVAHLSAYALIYEEGTVLDNLRRRGEVAEATDETSLAMFETLMNIAADKGFEHYEISNFALSGRRARHNASYWTGLPYLGCGPGAHSFDGLNRHHNLPDLNAYIAQPGNPVQEEEELSLDERFNDRILTALRTSDGLRMAQIEAEYPSSYHAALLRAAHPYIERGQLTLADGILRLTRSGIFVSDLVMSDLMRV